MESNIPKQKHGRHCTHCMCPMHPGTSSRYIKNYAYWVCDYCGFIQTSDVSHYVDKKHTLGMAYGSIHSNKVLTYEELLKEA